MSIRHFSTSWFRHSRWLLLFFILGSCKADDPPTAADLSKIEITLQRSACFGVCPAYKVTIHGDGLVVFTTELRPDEPASALFAATEKREGMVFLGTHEDRIAPGTVAALFGHHEFGAHDPKRAYTPLSALTDRTVEMFCPMRQRTPVGSTSTKSRMPEGRSSGGSVFVSYLDAIPCAWT